MNDQPRCRCDSIDHGQLKGACSEPPRPVGDGLCQMCSDKIALAMGDISAAMPLTPGR
jgi:hypothetical protein